MSLMQNSQHHTINHIYSSDLCLKLLYNKQYMLLIFMYHCMYNLKHFWHIEDP